MMQCLEGALMRNWCSREWQQLLDQQPSGAKLVIALPKPAFFLGERIPLHRAFTSTQPKSFLADTMRHDRVGRMNSAEEFVVDPSSSIEDPLRELQGETGGMELDHSVLAAGHRLAPQL